MRRSVSDTSRCRVAAVLLRRIFEAIRALRKPSRYLRLLTTSKQGNTFNANVEEGQAIKDGVYLNKIDKKDNTRTVETTGNLQRHQVRGR